MECRFCPEMRMEDHDGPLGKMFSVIPSKVHNMLQENQTSVWYQDDISMSDNRLVGTFQFGTIGEN